MTKILIAEDSTLIQKLLKNILTKEASFEIVGTAYDGESVCIMAEKLIPDIILMDIRMPKMSGLEAIKKIMSENPTPIIVLTSFEPAEEIKAQALKYGAVSFILKPKALDYSFVSTKLINDIKTFSRVKLTKKAFL